MSPALNHDIEERTNMAIQINERLPQALAALARGTPRWHVLYFMRTADCAICRGHVRRLLALTPVLNSLGAQLTFLAPDAQLPEWARASDVPLVLGPDAFRVAGFERTLGAVQQSGLIVAREGHVVALRRATLPFQAFDERELLRVLEAQAPTHGLAAPHAP